MKRIIAGGTGFIGHHLVSKWQEEHELIIIGRDKDKIKDTYPNLSAVTWNELDNNYQDIFTHCDAVINLAGANIGAKLWTKKRKQLILESRTLTTKRISSYLANLSGATPILLNASAVGIYGLQENKNSELPPELTEDTAIDFQQEPDFLAKVGRAWELATEPAKSKNVRVINMRFGIVLAQDSGVLPRLALPYKFGLGGKIGTGNQPVTWIHISDLLSAIEFVIKHSKLHGPINFTSPGAVTQEQFAKALGKILNKPTFITIPGFALKMIFGQMAEELLLKGQHVKPKKLLQAGFDFEYPSLEKALKAIYGKKNKKAL